MFLLNETRSDKANRLIRILMRIQKISNQLMTFFGRDVISTSFLARGATTTLREVSNRLNLRGILQLKKLYGSLERSDFSVGSESGDPNE